MAEEEEETWRDGGKRRNREREERNPPPYALTPSKGTTTHALLQARIHTLQAFLLELWPRVKLYYVGIRGQKNESTIVFRIGIRCREDGKGFLCMDEKKLENGNEKEKNKIGK